MEETFEKLHKLLLSYFGKRVQSTPQEQGETALEKEQLPSSTDINVEKNSYVKQFMKRSIFLDPGRRQALKRKSNKTYLIGTSTELEDYIDDSPYPESHIYVLKWLLPLSCILVHFWPRAEIT